MVETTLGVQARCSHVPTLLQELNGRAGKHYKNQNKRNETDTKRVERAGSGHPPLPFFPMKSPSPFILANTLEFGGPGSSYKRGNEDGPRLAVTLLSDSS